MNHISGVGGYGSSAKWRKTSLSKRDQKALATLEPEHRVEEMIQAHRETENLRRFAEGFKQRPISKESVAQFDLDQESGAIYIKITDADTGQVQYKLTPDEVAQGLRHLEETGDNASTLSSFFIDLKI